MLGLNLPRARGSPRGHPQDRARLPRYHHPSNNHSKDLLPSSNPYLSSSHRDLPKALPPTRPIKVNDLPSKVPLLKTGPRTRGRTTWPWTISISIVFLTCHPNTPEKTSLKTSKETWNWEEATNNSYTNWVTAAEHVQFVPAGAAWSILTNKSTKVM